MIASVHFSKTVLLILATAFFALGCSKKPEKPVDASPSASAVKSEANGAMESFNQSLEEADAAARSGACLKALRSLLALEKQPLTQEQTQRLQSHFASLKEKLNEVINREPYNQDALEAMSILKRQNR